MLVVKNSDIGLSRELIENHLKQLCSIFPTCRKLDLALDFLLYPASLDIDFQNYDLSVRLSIDIANMNLSNLQVFSENAPYNSVKHLTVTNSNDQLPPIFILSKIRGFASMLPSLEEIDICQLDYSVYKDDLVEVLKTITGIKIKYPNRYDSLNL